PDGARATSFTGTGTGTPALGPGDHYPGALVLQPHAKLVAAGESYNGSNYDFALVRYNADGSLDTSFNGTGKVTTPIGSGNDDANALVLQPDRKPDTAGVTR